MSDTPDREAMRSDVTAMRNEVVERISEEGEATRRHFDVVAERIESTVRFLFEIHSHHTTLLDDHEARLKRIEKRRR